MVSQKCIPHIKRPKYNVTVSTTEPSIKNGIWVKTNKPFLNIIVDSEYSVESELSTTLLGAVCRNPSVKIGDYIYTFGSGTTLTNSYKYDLTTKSSIRIADCPYIPYNGKAVAVGTDIYIFGGSINTTTNRAAYKYDTINDTYSALATLTIIVNNLYNIHYDGSNYIYMAFGTNIFRYDISSNTYTTLYTTTGVVILTSSLDATNNKIYCMHTNSLYMYDISVNTFTRLMTYPYTVNIEQYFSVLGDDDCIYLFPTQTRFAKCIIKINLYTNRLYSIVSTLKYTPAIYAYIIYDKQLDQFYMLGGLYTEYQYDILKIKLIKKVSIPVSRNTIFINASIVDVPGVSYITNLTTDIDGIQYDDYSSELMSTTGIASIDCFENGAPAAAIPIYVGNGSTFVAI